MNNFNSIASYYDVLANLIFGKVLDQAAFKYLDIVKEDSNVLVLGGGTGRILGRIPKCNSITYVDSAVEMVVRSRRVGGERITYVVDDFRKWKPERKYDVIVCLFFLDCFDRNGLNEVLEKVDASLTTKGIFLVADFQDGSGSLLMIAMHVFFRLFAGLEAKRLLNIHEHILQKNFSVQSEEFFHKNMIFSRVYGNL